MIQYLYILLILAALVIPARPDGCFVEYPGLVSAWMDT